MTKLHKYVIPTITVGIVLLEVDKSSQWQHILVMNH